MNDAAVTAPPGAPRSVAPAPAPPANPLSAGANAARDRLRAKHQKPPLASQGNRPSSPSAPDPLSIRHIPSVAYDPNGSHDLTEAGSQVDYQAPMGGGEPTLWVNRQAVVTLLRAGEWPVLAERHGMTFEAQHSRATVDGLRKMVESASDPHQRQALQALSRAILRASDLEGSPRPIAVVQAGPEMTREEILAAQQEEWDHIAGIRLGGGTIDGLIDYEAVRRAAPEEVAIAEAALEGGNYGDPAHYAHEIYVRLLRQRCAELDLSPEQAKTLDHRSLNIDTFNPIYVLMGHALPEEAQSRPVRRAGHAQARVHPQVSNRGEAAHSSGSFSFGFAIRPE